jgi:catechol 2,3-dioxygenase-like lactoylglutathione lyase family enzyme
MPQIHGVLETALYVADLDRAEAFYRDLFGFPTVLADERMRALAVPGRHVLLLFKKGGSTRPTETPGGAIPPHDGDGRLHLAFAISADDVEAWERKLAEREIEVESRVTAARGGTSVYFRDPDGHCIEVATPGLWPVY